MTAYIGYENHADTATTITESDQMSDYPAENALDFLPVTCWKPGATGTVDLTFDFSGNVTADYYAIGAHNLGSQGATVALQYSTDGGSSWSNLGSAHTPADDRPIFQILTSQAEDDWRLLITNCTAQVYIGVFAFGRALQLPREIPPGDWAPAQYAGKNEINTNKSDRGSFLGRSVIARGITGTIKQLYIQPAWIRSNWPALAAHLDTKPFFYAWDPDNYPTEIGLYWTPDGAKPPIYMAGNPLFMEFEIKAEGVA